MDKLKIFALFCCIVLCDNCYSQYDFSKSISLSGDLLVGTNNADNIEGWNRYVNIFGNEHSKLLVSSSNVIAGMWAHNYGYYGAPAGGIVGTYTNSPFTIVTSKTPRLFISESGYVGIGTLAPITKLAVDGDISVGVFNDKISGYGNKLWFLGADSNTDALWLSRFNNGANSSELRINIGDDYGQPNDKFNVGVTHWDGDAWKSLLVVQANGNVGVGVENPTGKLDVNGVIRAKEVRVESGEWADYVFSSGYKLRSTSDIKKFINDNGHLPDIPSAEEVKMNGVSVGDMNVKLLRKIEELTLILINQDEEIKLLKHEMKKVKEQKTHRKRVR